MRSVSVFLMMGKLDRKVALISGGARGLGAATAKKFALKGAKVVLGDIRDADGTKVQETISSEGGDAVYLHLDVTDESDWRNAIATAMSRYGALHVLINNAGIGIPRVPIDQLAVDD